MRKVVIPRAGSYERLQIQEGPEPTPGAGEVRIVVEAIGVNYADCVVRMGLYASAKKYVGWPITPGFEVAGSVDAVGEGVTGLKEGDAVFAVTRFGGYASSLVVPRHQVFPLPHGFSVDEAAGFPAVFLTAYYAKFGLANPREGDRVLVHSAAGGVGGALLQLGKIAGCETVGVVGASHKVEAAQALGASAVIDKSKEDLWTAAKRLAPGGYHIVYDANGVATLAKSYAHLAEPGKLVIYGFHSMLPRRGGKPNLLKLLWGYLRTPRFNPLEMTGANRSILAFNLSYLFAEQTLLTEAMAQMLAWCEEELLQPPQTQVYSLDDVAQAHRDLESGQTIGKLILKP